MFSHVIIFSAETQTWNSSGPLQQYIMLITEQSTTADVIVDTDIAYITRYHISEDSMRIQDSLLYQYYFTL